MAAVRHLDREHALRHAGQCQDSLKAQIRTYYEWRKTMDLIVTVREIKGSCPVYKLGDSFVLENARGGSHPESGWYQQWA